MKHFGSFIVVGLFAFSLSHAAAQDRFVPRITVTGEASVTTVPDMATIRTGITSQGKLAKETSDANAKTANALVAALRASGIADKDIQTAALSLQPTYENTVSSGRGRINGFQASTQLIIKVHEIPKLADVIDRVVAAGASDINGIEFIVSAPSLALDAARTEAIADARRKAEIYAKAADVKLARVIALSENGATPEPMMMMAEARVGRSSPVVMPGEKTLRLTTTVTYELAN